MMLKKIAFVFCLASVCVLCRSAWAAQPSSVDSNFPSIESACRISGALNFCGEPVPFENQEVRERLEKEIALIVWDRAQTLLWLKRTGRYFPYIEKELKRRGMPDDLKYLAVIESALRPHAGSPKNARGYWQFIPGTGRKYGLRIDRAVDERRDFRLATQAALNYLNELHQMFGSWALAAAAYNMGEAGLKRAIEAQEVQDYYKLHLPRETQRYVPRAVIAKMVLRNPARFGYRLLESDYYAPESVDLVRIRVRLATPVIIVAKSAQTYYKRIRDLNPQILQDSLPPGVHTIALPRGGSEGFADRFRKYMAKYRAERKGNVYKVKKGDSLLRIAQKHRVSFSRLLKENGLRRNSTIHPGQELVIP